MSVAIDTVNGDVVISSAEEFADAITKLPKSRMNKGLSGFFGRSENVFDNTVNNTFRAVITIQADSFSSLSVVFNQSGDTPLQVSKAEIKVVSKATDIDDSTSTGWIPLTFNKQQSGTGKLPNNDGSVGLARSYGLLVSDKLALNSIPRTDGGDGCLVLISAFVTSITLTTTGDSTGSTNRANWIDNLENTFVYKNVAGDAIADKTLFSGIFRVGYSPICAVEFETSDSVVSVVNLGDSISEGAGGGNTYTGKGGTYFGAKYAEHNCSVCNCAWSGDAINNFTNRLDNLLQAGIVPDVVTLNVFTPNSFGADVNTVTDVFIARCLTEVKKLITLSNLYSFRVILLTGLPITLRDYGLSDTLRQVYNKSITHSAKAQVSVVDVDKLLSESASDANNRFALNPIYSSDTVHPNEAGYDLMGVEIAKAIDDQALQLRDSLV